MREYLALHSPPINSFDCDPSFDTRMAKVSHPLRLTFNIIKLRFSKSVVSTKYLYGLIPHSHIYLM